MVFAIDGFMDYLSIQKNLSENTIRAYSTDLRDFNSFLCGQFFKEGDEAIFELSAHSNNGSTILDSITKNDIKSYIGYMFDIGLSKASMERKIAAIRSFFKYLNRSNVLENNPAENIIYPKKNKRLPRFFKPGEIDSILNFKLESFIDYRDLAIIELFYSTGCRVGELSGADLLNVDMESRRLKVLGKGREERLVFITQTAAVALKNYLVEREKKLGNLSEPLFVNNQGKRLSERGLFSIVTKRAKDAGFSGKLGPHTYRHSFATDMLNAGADLRAVQEMLGHKNLSTTQIYTHTTKNRLKEVYNKSHPQAKNNKNEE